MLRYVGKDAGHFQKSQTTIVFNNNPNTYHITFHYNPEENISKCGELGGIDIILNAIKTHINNTDVCEKGCLALSNITLTSNNSIHNSQFTIQFNSTQLGFH